MFRGRLEGSGNAVVADLGVASTTGPLIESVLPHNQKSRKGQPFRYIE